MKCIREVNKRFYLWCVVPNRQVSSMDSSTDLTRDSEQSAYDTGMYMIHGELSDPDLQSRNGSQEGVREFIVRMPVLCSENRRGVR